MQDLILNDYAALIERLRAFKAGLIAFDGRPGAGKTTLMKKVARDLNCRGIDADDFLERDRLVFVDALRIADLRGRIEISFSSSPFVLLATVCALSVLERLGALDAKVIYVEETSAVRLQQSKMYFYEDLDAPTSNEHPLRREVEIYHRERNPKQMANVAYLWAPNDGSESGSGPFAP